MLSDQTAIQEKTKLSTVSLTEVAQAQYINRVESVSVKPNSVEPSDQINTMWVWQDDRTAQWHYIAHITGHQFEGEFSQSQDGGVIAQLSEQGPGDITGSLDERWRRELTRPITGFTHQQQDEMTAHFETYWPLNDSMSREIQIEICQTILKKALWSKASVIEEPLDEVTIERNIRALRHQLLASQVSKLNALPSIRDVSDGAKPRIQDIISFIHHLIVMAAQMLGCTDSLIIPRSINNSQLLCGKFPKLTPCNELVANVFYDMDFRSPGGADTLCNFTLLFFDIMTASSPAAQLRRFNKIDPLFLFNTVVNMNSQTMSQLVGLYKIIASMQASLGWFFDGGAKTDPKNVELDNRTKKIVDAIQSMPLPDIVATSEKGTPYSKDAAITMFYSQLKVLGGELSTYIALYCAVKEEVIQQLHTKERLQKLIAAPVIVEALLKELPPGMIESFINKSGVAVALHFNKVASVIRLIKGAGLKKVQAACVALKKGKQLSPLTFDGDFNKFRKALTGLRDEDQDFIVSRSIDAIFSCKPPVCMELLTDLKKTALRGFMKKIISTDSIDQLKIELQTLAGIASRIGDDGVMSLLVVALYNKNGLIPYLINPKNFLVALSCLQGDLPCALINTLVKNEVRPSVFAGTNGELSDLLIEVAYSEQSVLLDYLHRHNALKSLIRSFEDLKPVLESLGEGQDDVKIALLKNCLNIECSSSFIGNNEELLGLLENIGVSSAERWRHSAERPVECQPIVMNYLSTMSVDQLTPLFSHFSEVANVLAVLTSDLHVGLIELLKTKGLLATLFPTERHQSHFREGLSEEHCEKIMGIIAESTGLLSAPVVPLSGTILALYGESKSEEAGASGHKRKADQVAQEDQADQEDCGPSSKKSSV